MNRILLFMVLFICATPSYSQDTQFKTYTDSLHRFSFDIPASWQIQYNKKKGGYIGITTNKEEQDMLDKCAGGFMFRLRFLSPRLKVMEGERIKGMNWTGIYHKFACGYSCKGDVYYRSDAGYEYMGVCEFIYFSGDKLTVCFRSNAWPINESIRKKMIASFRFF